MSGKIKITAVNYLNTFPFRYAFNQVSDIHQWAEINYATPFECAQMLLDKQTDIALAPVAILHHNSHLSIITDFCISTHTKVESVKLYSHKPIDQINTITLDYQSLSSVSLIKVLMKYYWKKEVQYVQGKKGFEKDFDTDAIVVIGDRTFELNGTFQYEYDLAEEWYRYYQKPFVFAAWISHLNIQNDYIQQLNAAFDFAIQHLDLVIDDVLKNTNILGHRDESNRLITISRYLKDNIYYRLTEDRQQSIHHFLHLLSTIEKITPTRV